jgi:hypothetical protein
VARRKADPDADKDPAAKKTTIKIRVDQVADLERLAQLKGVAVYRVLEELLDALLPAELGAYEAQLKRMAKVNEELAAIRKAARRHPPGRPAGG